MTTAPPLYARIYLLCRQIPPGQVTSYGDVAAMVGGGCDARTVGEALRAMGEHAPDVPWQRIVSQDGAISTRGLEQRRLLEAEGVAFDRRGRALMVHHRWAGPDMAFAAAHRFGPPPPHDDAPEQLELF
ncbi:MGMT family protein [Oscillochloris sp. ZM17-4]|uniref:MGMT family protein n=1 Tax=Oscillochloris sp. ZM17-4 TaxID=2866714 RepID=UPI001C72C1B8|nr:MGMT family protein [Oscillochloris sp. ZM17-4]MBX0326392.1 MGMT family protein [Oscillochloris sp. ZM17-4]